MLFSLDIHFPTFVLSSRCHRKATDRLCLMDFCKGLASGIKGHHTLSMVTEFIRLCQWSEDGYHICILPKMIFHNYWMITRIYEISLYTIIVSVYDIYIQREYNGYWITTVMSRNCVRMQLTKLSQYFPISKRQVYHASSQRNPIWTYVHHDNHYQFLCLN